MPANQGVGYGDTARARAKIDSKYKKEDEMKIREWICSHLNMTIDKYEYPPGKDGFALLLKDGEILRRLMNHFKPGAIPEPKKKFTGQFAQNQAREQISKAINVAIEDFGVRKQSVFDVNDLYEMRNMTQVVEFFMVLGGAVQALPNFEGMALGPKPSEKNERNFTDEQIKQSRDSAVSMQAGTNKIGSQNSESFRNISAYSAK